MHNNTAGYTYNCDQRKPAKAATFQVPAYFARKPKWMRLFSALLLVLLLPVLLLLMLAVRLSSPGPALFRQKRLGRNGQEFNLFKLRTMYQDAEAVSGPALCQPGDSRITPFGRFLRNLHLDELPQLVNVVRGQMCLVGPRPERPEIIARNRLRETVPGFDLRTKVLPGVTGLAQINLPPDVDAASVIPKVQLDLKYIETATAGLDFRILLCTALRMLGVRDGLAVGWLRLGRQAPVDRNQVSHPVAAPPVARIGPRPPLANGSRPTPIPAPALAGSSANGRHRELIATDVTTAVDEEDGVELEDATVTAALAVVPRSKPR